MGKLIAVLLLVLAASSAFAYPKTINPSSLVGHWPMEEGSGTTTRDASGKGSTGTLTNGPTWVVGKYGSAVSFDGSNDFISLGSPTILSFVNRTNQYSITAWVRRASSPAITTSEQIISKSSNSINTFELKLTPGGITASGGGTDSVVTSPVADGTWHHIATTIPASSAGLRVYVDGSVKPFSSGSGGIGTGSTTRDVLIGARRDASNSDSLRWFTGSIDDVRIYNRVLSASEIMQMYMSGRQHWSQ